MKALVVIVWLCSVAAANPRRVVTSSSIEILDPITFVGATPAIAPSSKKIIDAIAQTLQSNPSIRLLEVRASGADASRDQWLLGQRRTFAIIGELVRRGISPARLQAGGQTPGNPSPEFIIVK